MQQVPECPQCGVEVQPHWDRCEACGYSHHDDEPEGAPTSSPDAPPGFFDAPRPDEVGAPGDPDPYTPASYEPPSYTPASYEPPSYEPPSFEPPGIPSHSDDVDVVPGPGLTSTEDRPPPPPPPPPPPLEPPSFASAEPDPDPGSPSTSPSTSTSSSQAAPLASWQDQSRPASAAIVGAAGPGGDDPDESTRPDEADQSTPGKRITAADGARSSSSFEPNKAIVGVALVLAVLVLGWQGFALLSSEDTAVTAGPPGSTIPPLGEIAPVTAPLTTPDGVTIVPPVETTTTIDTLRDCDSVTSIHSSDGKGYKPCDAGFVVDLPGRADIRTSVSETALGPVRWSSFTSTDNSQDPWVRSIVVYGDLPREVAPEETGGVEEALITQLLAQPGAATTFQDQPARAFSTTDSNGDRVSGIAFVRGTRAYAIAARSPGSPDSGLDALERSFAFI